MYWKVTYLWWCSVVKQTMYVKANTEKEAWKLADSQFGYEEADITSVEPVTEEEILKNVVVGL